MNCSDLIRRLVEGSLSDPPAQEHLAGCAHCREMLASWDSKDGPDQAHLARIQQQITSRWRPVKPIASIATLLVVLLLLFFASTVGVAALLGNFALRALGPWQLVIYFGGLSLCAAFTAALVAPLMVPGARTRLDPRYTIPALAVVIVTLIALLFPNFNTAFLHGGDQCFWTGLTAAAVAALLFTTFLRRTLPSSPVVAGASVGFLAGLCGVTVLALHCAFLAATHILVWHFGVLVVATLAGAIAGYVVQWVSQKNMLAYRNS
jgi:hypothetical protein